jgi:hypothetical protein
LELGRVDAAYVHSKRCLFSRPSDSIGSSNAAIASSIEPLTATTAVSSTPAPPPPPPLPPPPPPLSYANGTASTTAKKSSSPRLKTSRTLYDLFFGTTTNSTAPSAGIVAGAESGKENAAPPDRLDVVVQRL